MVEASLSRGKRGFLVHFGDLSVQRVECDAKRARQVVVRREQRR